MYNDDLAALNTWEEPKKVSMRVDKLSYAEFGGKKSIKPHSWCFFVLDGKMSA